jgi:hypothetical protein
MTPFHYFTQPSNSSFHNLCQEAQPPPGIASLLGLGLQFCIESARPDQEIEKGIRRFQRSIRLHFQFAEEARKKALDNEVPLPDLPAATNYIPSLYIPSNWAPSLKKDSVEFALANFDRKLNDYQRALPRHRRHNLAPSTRNVIRELRN